MTVNSFNSYFKMTWEEMIIYAGFLFMRDRWGIENLVLKNFSWLIVIASHYEY